MIHPERDHHLFELALPPETARQISARASSTKMACERSAALIASPAASRGGGNSSKSCSAFIVNVGSEANLRLDVPVVDSLGMELLLEEFFHPDRLDTRSKGISGIKEKRPP